MRQMAREATQSTRSLVHQSIYLPEQIEEASLDQQAKKKKKHANSIQCTFRDFMMQNLAGRQAGRQTDSLYRPLQTPSTPDLRLVAS